MLEDIVRRGKDLYSKDDTYAKVFATVYEDHWGCNWEKFADAFFDLQLSKFGQISMAEEWIKHLTSKLVLVSKHKSKTHPLSEDFNPEW